MKHATHDVLIVDPDASIASCLVLFLRMHGYRTVATHGARGTLEVLRAGFRPCVVIADPRSPDPGAWLFLEDLRADSVLAKVPIVLASDCGWQLRRAIRSGFAAVIEKPAAPRRWVEAVERQCRFQWWLRMPAEPEAARPGRRLTRGMIRQVSRRTSKIARHPATASGRAGFR